ncbi:MAG: hypothetical protein Q9165_005308 [Trypethelium subeluteriae]
MQSTQNSSSSFEIISPSSESSGKSGPPIAQSDSSPSHSMPATIRKYKAAAVQAEPGWFDLEKSVQKTVTLIDEAGQKGCKLVAFPETCHLYMAQIIVAPTGNVINHRRKIKPTHVERLVFGEGTGDSLTSVVETEIGNLGHLNCWENMNPFLKAHACALHEQIHVAAWPVYPPASTLRYPDPYTNMSELQSELVTPAYAYETGTWTLAPTQVVTREGAKLNMPRRLREDDVLVDAEAAVIGNGFARFYRPDGYRAVEDPPKTFDGLLITNVDLDENLLTKRLADFGGHYMRPDLIRLLVDKTPKTYVVDANSPDPQTFPSTLERLGLNKPLPLEES